MLIEKLEINLYEPVNCLKFRRQFIMFHAMKNDTQWKKDKEKFETYIQTNLSQSIVEFLIEQDLEEICFEFWGEIGLGYTIVQTNGEWATVGNKEN